MTQATRIQRTTSESARAVGAVRSLIVAIDLTPSADRVLGRLALLPLADDARVTLLHVVPGSFHATEQGLATRDANRALLAEARHLRQQLHRKTQLEILVKVGAAAKQIASCAKQTKAELIVMGRGGGRAVRDAFLGSTAERVVRQARLPVLVVRLAPRGAYVRPSLALDLDRTAHDVIGVMLRVLPARPPRVEVIHAFDVPYQGMIYPSLSTREAEVRKDELELKASRKLAKLLAAALADAEVRPEDGPLWKTHVRHGSPRRVVEKALKRSDADLLVLGTQGHAGAAYMLMGTVAGDLLRAARCDVLVVPPASRG